MEFKFDPNQQYQHDAIDAVVDLFEGQPRYADRLLTTLQEQPTQDNLQLLTLEIGAVGNNLLLDKPAILQNLQRIQDRNGLEVLDSSPFWSTGKRSPRPIVCLRSSALPISRSAQIWNTLGLSQPSRRAE